MNKLSVTDWLLVIVMVCAIAMCFLGMLTSDLVTVGIGAILVLGVAIYWKVA